MKKTPEENKIEKNFLPGALSSKGFLGKDTRHIHDIILDDDRLLSKLGLDRNALAVQLQKILNTGKAGLEAPVDYGDFQIVTKWDRGMGPCPFGEPGLYPRITVTICSKDTRANLCVSYTQLSIHLIRKHGFLGGKGSPFRIDPEKFINLGIILPGSSKTD